MGIAQTSLEKKINCNIPLNLLSMQPLFLLNHLTFSLYLEFSQVPKNHGELLLFLRKSNQICTLYRVLIRWHVYVGPGLHPHPRRKKTNWLESQYLKGSSINLQIQAIIRPWYHPTTIESKKIYFIQNYIWNAEPWPWRWAH